MMNWIWLGLILLSIIVGGFTGQMQAVTIRSFESAKEAVWLAFKLIGIMAFWLGVMKVAEHSGLMRTIARLLRRPMRWLFPDVPENHPAMSAMIMNFGANIMGLANAATPFGILAMVELAKLNKHKGTASDAMCLFLAINTSSLTLLATGTIGLRAAAGSVDPAGIWLPSLAASACATLVGIASAKLLQRMIRFRLPELPAGSLAPEGAGSADELLDAGLEDPEPAAPEVPEATRGERASLPVRLFCWACVLAFCAAAVIHYTRWGMEASELTSLLSGWAEAGLWPADLFETMAAVSMAVAGFCGSCEALHVQFDPAGVTRSLLEFGFWPAVMNFFSFWAIPALMGGLLLFGLARGVRVYESLVEGAREGFRVAVRIIPYMVAIIVAVAMFKASGAMELLKQTVGQVTGALGMPAEVLPMAIIRPLSGNGAFGYMSSIFTQYGPDSFVGQMVSVMQGSTETTLYVLAVYFGAVRVYRVRHALAAGLLADLAGIVAAVALCHFFF